MDLAQCQPGEAVAAIISLSWIHGSENEWMNASLRISTASSTHSQILLLHGRTTQYLSAVINVLKFINAVVTLRNSGTNLPESDCS